MSKEEHATYRENPKWSTTEVLDDHEGRLEVLEHFIDGRAQCSGDALWNEVTNVVRDVSSIRYVLIGIVLCFVFTLLGALVFAERMHDETQDQIREQQHQIELLEHRCGEAKGWRSTGRTSNGL